MKVFLVDDNPIALQMLSRTLNNAGFVTAVAGDGIEALDKIPIEQPDAIILDIMMPELDGFQVARQLRADPITRHIPILVLTAKDQVEDKIMGFDAGADDFVVKPVMPAELIARINSLIRRAAVYAEAAQAQRGRLITFLGVKGGVGTTTLAVNIALALAQQQRNIILADLHWWASAVAAYLGMKPQSSLVTLTAKEPAEITRQMIEECLELHPSGLRVATAVHRRSEQVEPLSNKQMTIALTHLETMSEIVILDAGCGLTPIAVEAMRCHSTDPNSHFVVLVVEPDAVALALAQDMLYRLDQLGLAGSRLGLVVVNRWQTTPTVVGADIETLLGTKPLAILAPASDMFMHASQTGMPVLLSQPDTALAAQIRDLAGLISEP